MFKHLIKYTQSILIFGLGMICIKACQKAQTVDQAQKIVDQAIKAHGGKIFDQANVEFKFRDRYYKSSRMNGKYRYERFWDSLGIIIHDELSNSGFIRHVGETMVILDSKKIDSYTSSINGVMYFFGIPFNLNDPGVIKEYLGEVTLMAQRYDKIKISFEADPTNRLIHDDTYVYWINKDSHTIDYLGYDYTEPDDKGTRFRQAINARMVSGLRVQDYVNFKPINDSIALAPEDLDQAWIGHQLVELSKIINENVKVTLKK